MNANELKLAILKSQGTIVLDNGRTIKFIRMVEKSEWRASVGDTKSRAIVSVDGVECNYPYSIDQIQKFADTGILAKFHANAIGQTAAAIASVDAAKENKTRTNINTSKRNLRPVSEFTCTNIWLQSYERATNYKRALAFVSECESVFGLRRDTAVVMNALSAMPIVKKYDTLCALVAKRTAQYQRARAARIERLKKEIETADTICGVYCAKHVATLFKDKEQQEEAARLSNIANAAREKLKQEEARKFYTDTDIKKKYGLL